MNAAAHDHRALVPLAYHSTVVDYLQKNEPEVWRWAGDRAEQGDQLESLRSMLLRDTYRIDAEAHAEIHATLSTAMERLGIAVPATLYQSPGQDMNASLIHVPGEIHIVVQGPLLERLSREELLAVFGHELAHYLLWSRDEGQYRVADRILSETFESSGASVSHHETWRRYALHGELFADRGGAIAANALAPAISALVKVQTGMSRVDAASYLRQAIEIESSEASASHALSHPETFIRARGLALWWEGDSDLEPWIARRLHGSLVLERLDLPGQMRLQALTRGFLAHYLAGTPLASDAVLAQIRSLFPDWREDEPAIGPGDLGPDAADDSVLGYFNALMLDLALADPDQREAALLRAGQIAQELGSFDALQASLRRDAGFGRREMDRFKRQLKSESKSESKSTKGAKA